MGAVRQPSARPTNKLTAAVLATAFTNIARVMLNHFYPGMFDGPFWAAMDPAAALLVGWVVKDEDNTP